MNENTNTLLIAVNTQKRDDLFTTTESVIELKELAKTAKLNVIETIVQARQAPHNALYLGTGKVDEIKTLIKEHQINIIVADDELSPSQHKNLEKHFEIKLMDRTSLILAIFAQRAATYEAKLQVELAQLQYLKPRLTNMWQHLSRTAGGIGTKGPGETQLETDKRLIDDRLKILKRKLEKVAQSRRESRKSRLTKDILVGSLIGYTNAGKSTLLNTLANDNTLVEDQLFATLDPTTRQIITKSGEKLLISDTVGFIQKLPTQLINSFKATLEEVVDSDFLMHVIDCNDPKLSEKIITVNTILKELNATEIPVIYVFNKADLIEDIVALKISLDEYQPKCFISANQCFGIDSFFEEVNGLLNQFKKEHTFKISYNNMDIVNILHEQSNVLSVEYTDVITIKTQIKHVLINKIMGMLHE